MSTWTSDEPKFEKSLEARRAGQEGGVRQHETTGGQGLATRRRRMLERAVSTACPMPARRKFYAASSTSTPTGSHRMSRRMSSGARANSRSISSRPCRKCFQPS